VAGVDKVARLLEAGMAAWGAVMTAELAHVNGWPALIIRLDGEIDSVMSMRVEDGLVSGIYTVRNPEKLSRIMREAAVSR
jgi:RNA polymerase sigma-70 factor (ECF subfamily)